MSSLDESKCMHSIKYIAIEEKVSAFVSLLYNRTKPLPVYPKHCHVPKHCH